MGFKKPVETSLEVSGYARAVELGALLLEIEQAIDAYGVDLSEEEPDHNPYSAFRNYKVTLTIEEI